MTKAKILILLSLSLVIQSLSSVFIKFAGQYETLSREFIIFYVLADVLASMRSCGSFCWN